jgi:hypothetical protein
MSEAQAALSPDHPLMKAWKAYEATDGFKDSLYWATTLTVMRKERAAELGIHPDDNRADSLKREQYAKGALWAAFLAGFDAGLDWHPEAQTEHSRVLAFAIDVAKDIAKLPLKIVRRCQ